MWLTKRDLFKASLAATGTLVLPSTSQSVSYSEYMLHLINIERKKAGVDPVELGTNRAEQVHADNLVKFCTISHWGC